jgi:DNA-binding transcriptional MerR regulator
MSTVAEVHPAPAPSAPATRLLKIGQLAARSGLTARNLRFYADAGVFGDLPRSPKGYRLFPPQAVQWVRILKASQAAGFSLEEVQELLRALRQDSAPCAHVRDALGGKLRVLEGKLAEIQLLVEILRITLRTPDGQSSDLGCNLMETLLTEAKRLPALTELRA